MKRRNFIIRSSVLGSTFILTPLSGTSEITRTDNLTRTSKDVINKVKIAMLSMQRASWEQGVGNGWSATGITRVVRALPDEMQSERQELTGYIKEVLDGCLKYIRSDYLFHNVVDESSTFVETNLSQMLAYTIFSGVKDSWLDKGYLDYAYRMRDAAHKKVDKYGYVQGVCGAPYFDKPGRATEGQAFFLLMEAAFDKLAKSADM